MRRISAVLAAVLLGVLSLPALASLETTGFDSIFFGE